MTKVLDSFCRTCMVKVAEQTNQIIASFHIFQTEDFAHKFTQCTNLQAHPDDEYPSSVCENCLASVLSLYDFQIMCRDSIDKFSSMLVENKPESENYCHLGNNNSSEFLSTMANQVVIKCEEYDLPELAAVVDPLLAPTNSELAEIELQVQEPTSGNNRKSKRSKHLKRPSEPGIRDLQATNENQRTDEETTTEILAKKTKSNEKGSQDEIHCNEDEDKLENSSDEEGFNTDSDCASPDSKQKPSLGLPFQCDTCPKKFRFQHSFEAHIRRHQGQRGYPCTRQNCERTFNRLSYLQQHLNDHDGIPRTTYKCEFKDCEQSYTTKSGLREHKRKIHSGKPITRKIHMCETCGTVYAKITSLKEHRFIHIDKSEWPFVCDVEGCSKRFHVLAQFKVHQKRHAGIKNYACPHCEMRFVTSINLKNHINHHTREKTWACDFCPKVCITPATLRAHIRNNHGHRVDMHPHNEIKNKVKQTRRRYQCSFCDNTFLSVTVKKYHERIHTGEKPHVCDECGKKFRNPQALKTHMRTHIKDAPRDYVCRICGRAYFTSQNLKYHELKHTGEKPYKCDQCGLTFGWPSGLIGHQKLHHRDKQVKETTETDKQANSKDISKDE